MRWRCLKNWSYQSVIACKLLPPIILMKSRMVASEETQLQLQDAHKRVMSVAAVQRRLRTTGPTAQ